MCVYKYIYIYVYIVLKGTEWTVWHLNINVLSFEFIKIFWYVIMCFYFWVFASSIERKKKHLLLNIKTQGKP